MLRQLPLLFDDANIPYFSRAASYAPTKRHFASLSIGITTVAVCLVLFPRWVQFLLSGSQKQPQIRRSMDQIIVWWTSSNRWMLNKLRLVNAEVHWRGQEQLSPEKWYLVVSNHQTWADILLLQTYLLDEIPPLKFFTKSQLIWLPFIGQAMYVQGFPTSNA